MGTTLSNLHIHKLSIAEAESLLPDAIVKQFNPEWITVASNKFEVGTMDKIGRKLSKNIENSVLSVEILDEDLLILNVFKNGKNVAGHISESEYDSPKKIGKPANLVRELELPENYIEYFKWIFKCKDLGKKIQLLEKVLAIPLWIDYKMLAEEHADFATNEKDLAYVENYIKEKKASEKLKNATKAKLLMEFDGKIYKHLGYNKYLVHRPSEDGNYHSCKDYYIYYATDEGMLKCIFDVSKYYVDAYDQHLLTNNNVIAMVGCFPVNVKRDKIKYLLLNMKGEVIAETKLPRDAGYPISVFDDGTIVCKGYAPSPVTTKYNIHGEQLPIVDVDDHYVSPVLRNGYVYLCDYSEKTKKLEIIKKQIDGEIAAVLTLKENQTPKWRRFLFDKEDNFYYCVRSFENESRTDKLFYIDKDLNVIDEIALEALTDSAVLDEKNNRLYLSVFEEELLAVDIKGKNKIMRKKYQEDWILYAMDSKGCALLVKGQSTVEIFSPELNIISRHRLKGGI